MNSTKKEHGTQLAKTATRTQTTKGKQLPSGGHNKGMKKHKAECLEEGCQRRQHSRGVCSTHYMQYRRTGMAWPIAKQAGRKQESIKGRNTYMGAEYTTDRTCEVCAKTKHWQKFCLGAEHLRNTCRDCHREALAEQALAAPVGHHSRLKNKSTVGDLLQSIDRQIEKARRRTNSDA